MVSAELIKNKLKVLFLPRPARNRECGLGLEVAAGRTDRVGTPRMRRAWGKRSHITALALQASPPMPLPLGLAFKEDFLTEAG